MDIVTLSSTITPNCAGGETYFRFASPNLLTAQQAVRRLGDTNQKAVRELIPLGHKIVKTIYQYTGIPTSIGMGTTKTLAKVANRIAKQNVFFQNVYHLDEETRHYCLKQTPIEEIWGIGKRWA